ncbi:MAG: hypothetical protein AAF772_16015, partial [Acidobacteriota bacterium]
MSRSPNPRGIIARHVAAALLLVAVVGCAPAPDANDADAAAGAPATDDALAPLPPLPDLDTLAPAAATEFETRAARVTRLEADARSGASGRAWAWGELGSLFHAYTDFDAAARCYANAQRLDPDDFRWWYLAGHLTRSQGDFDASNHLLQRAAALR